MRRVEAEIGVAQLEGVKDRLRLIGVAGMTVVSCRVSDGRILTDRVKLELVVADDRVDGVVRAVMTVVRKDDSADGRISIAAVDGAIRISTGEEGEGAL